MRWRGNLMRERGRGRGGSCREAGGEGVLDVIMV